MEKAEALEVAREFVERHTVPPRERFQRDQFADVLAALSARAVALTLERKEGCQQLRERLAQCGDILHGIQRALRTINWDDRLPNWSKLTEEERERLLREEEDDNRILWRRRDPKRSLQEGTDCEHYYNPDRESLIYETARYLEQPWMSHPFIDYALVDAFITDELCAFGESLKRDIMPFPRDRLGTNKLYYLNKGDLKKMQSFNSGDGWNHLSKWATLLIVVPGSSLWLAHEGIALGNTAFQIWSVGLGVYVVYKSAPWLIRRFSTRELDLPVRALKLWDSMYEVWCMLQGPVINPTMLRDELLKTREKGAVWSPSVYSLVDRVVARDPAVWTTLLPRAER